MKKLIFSSMLLACTCLLPVNAEIAPIGTLSSSNALQQKQNVRGTVTDGTEPLIGAEVRVVGTTGGTITDMDGRFSLSNVPMNSIIRISYIGYDAKDIKYAGQTELKVILSEAAHSLDEVVVTALGIKREEKSLGYAMSTVNSDDLTKTSTANFATSLYGKASGVRIQAAPGGNTSAVSINIRGLNSITGTNQPLIILNGVPIRNGDANNSDYWSDQRVRSNGLVDINPEDIASISILKGASASALYGSEAANGVVMITTKSGKSSKGVGVSFTASLTGDFVAYMPKYQTTYGPGVRIGSRGSYEESTGGFYEREYNGQTYKSLRTSSTTFGPKYDGSDVLYYDGTVRKYEAQNTDPWDDVFRTAVNQTYNLAVSKGGEEGNMRFGYTYAHSTPNQYNSDYEKNNFSLTGNYKLNDQFSLSYSANYIVQHIKNRPYRISRLVANFGGMFNAYDDVDYLRNNTVTSQGYLNVTTPSNSPTPDESFAYDLAAGSLVNEYFWNIYGKTELENSNRLIASVTPSYQIMKGLKLQARVSTDLTTRENESKNATERPLAYGDPTGYYGLSEYRNQILYGDLMLMFDHKLTDKLGLTVNLGVQGRSEKTKMTGVGTNGGLSVENWFNLNASAKTASSSMTSIDFLKTSAFGTMSFSWDDFLYWESTARQEKVSSMSNGSNSFFYPSTNASFIYTSAFKDVLPEWYQYGKLRASYGIVGNSPAVYSAIQAYEQSANSGYIRNYTSMDLGNEKIKAEKKYEFEIGLENKFFDNRLGFELSYYHNTIKDQILRTTMPISSGATSILMNIGELENSGVEISAYGTPILTKDWRFDISANIAFNKNKVNKLAEGVNVLEHSNNDNGAWTLESHVGQPMGDFYAYDVLKDEKGNVIIGDDGFAKLTDERVKVGNAMPDAVGGINTNLTYKNFSLSATFDFRIGGDVMNVPYQYMMGRGSLTNSMKYRDAEHGGLTYYYENGDIASGNLIATSAAAGPNGEKVYDNGMILKGVNENGEKNTTMLAADQWYNWTYNWGTGDPTYYSHSLFDNSYVKLRELSLSYTLPTTITHKFACNNLTVSAFGRNLFFIYKNLPIFDAEATDGTSWMSQAAIGGSTVTTRTFGVSLRASF